MLFPDVQIIMADCYQIPMERQILSTMIKYMII